MKKLTGYCVISGITCLLMISSPSASVYYVAPKGDDAGPGSSEQPFASLQKGHDKAVAGDTVFIRGGTFAFSGKGAKDNCGVSISKSGESDSKRIYFVAYNHEVPVFDFANLTLSNATGAGILVTGKWLYFKGLEICNVPGPGTGANNGIWCNPCTNNTFELMNFHHNKGPGLSIANGTGGNLILNCDAHDNYDPQSASGAGQDGDGFGCHYQTSGPSTIYRGCRSWWNSDDGYDLFKQDVGVIMDHCWAMGSGYINSGKGTAASGNGGGFKMGHTYKNARHLIKNCVAWKNRAQGFYANHSDYGSDWYNNTAYNNGSAFDMRSDSKLAGENLHKLRNNIAFPSIKNITYPENAEMQYNSWDLNISPAAGDFLSVSDSLFTGPRRPDGSLPDIDFMKLSQSSKMIDKGTDVGLPFNGKSPDLGAYEFGGITAVCQQPAVAKHTPVVPLGGIEMRTIKCFDPAGRSLGTGLVANALVPVIYYTREITGEHRSSMTIRVK